eukprot:scpid106973/ scgid21647/ 
MHRLRPKQQDFAFYFGRTKVPQAQVRLKSRVKLVSAALPLPVLVLVFSSAPDDREAWLVECLCLSPVHPLPLPVLCMSAVIMHCQCHHGRDPTTCNVRST